MTPEALEKSSKRILQALTVSALLSGVIAGWLGARPVDLQPVAPPDDLFDIAYALDDSPYSGGGARDFVERPLFESDRTPYQPPPPRTAVEPPESVGIVFEDIDDATLVGVFSSGASTGAILVAKEGRIRLLLGDAFRGWTLSKVYPRSILLTAGRAPRSRSARLEMPLNSDRVASGWSGASMDEADRPQTSKEGEDQQGARDGQASQSSADAPSANPLTFEGMYQKRVSARKEQSNEQN